MQPITDIAILKNLKHTCEFFGHHGFEFDKKHKYFTGDLDAFFNCTPGAHFLEDNGFKLKFVDGCFYPFIFKTKPRHEYYSRYLNQAK